MSETAIEWASGKWEPVGGCSRASTGCENCYAERLIGTRFAGNPGLRGRYDALTRPTSNGPRFTGEMAFWADRLAEPLVRRKPTRYFVCSQADLFHEARPMPDIAAVLGVCVAARWHTHLLLTKRPEVMRAVFAKYTPAQAVEMAWSRKASVPYQKRHHLDALDACRFDARGDGWQDMAHIWCGVSAENQEAADERIPVLLQMPAAKRFVSYEPAIGPLDLDPPHCQYCDWNIEEPGIAVDGATPWCMHCDSEMAFGWYEGIDWIIAGCESGPGARPAPLEWVRSVRDQVLAARGGGEVPQPGDPHLFVKQWDVCGWCSGKGGTMAAGRCHGCNGAGQRGKVRKGCPALDGRSWSEVPV